MNTKLLPPRLYDGSITSRWFSMGSALDWACKSMLFKKLRGLQFGSLELIDQSGATAETHRFGNGGRRTDLAVRVVVHRASAFSRIALGGSIGTGESYVDGEWDCDHLTRLIQLFVANRELLNDIDGGMGGILAPFQKIAHRLRENSLQGSRANIQAHYDLGNDFFGLFLDQTWMYSAGVFLSDNSTLLEASTEKNDRICRKLGLTAQDHVVEIGTGWGGFAIHAAENYGCKVTTTTISKAQYDLAKSRINEAGLNDRIELLSKDYRDLEGQYDKLVSIEMIEAVGLRYLDTYFEKCSSLLKPEGAMLLQSIIIRDQFYEQAKKSVDFIQRHIFPGAGIPSILTINQAVADETDLRLFHQEDLTPHYAKTLRHWSENLAKESHQVGALGYPEHLNRLWQFYFAYCEGGFIERSIGCVQMLFEKPLCRKPSVFGRLS